MKAQVYNLNNEVVGDIDLPAGLFGVAWKEDLVLQVLRAHLANARRPWAHAKDRSEVRGGGRKPWRQKGTGRARHGSIRSPLWSGGGKAHGPNKERDFTQKINKKMNRAAILSVLSKKQLDGEVRIIDSLGIAEPKTKTLFASLKVALELTPRAKKCDVLLIPSIEQKEIFRASRNLVKTKAVGATGINVEDLMNYKRVFIDRAALPVMTRHFSKVGSGTTEVRSAENS
jgi:large subunit ribosomal protein L4